MLHCVYESNLVDFDVINATPITVCNCILGTSSVMRNIAYRRFFIALTIMMCGLIALNIYQ